MNESNQFIRFDWAAKRILRDKANFAVLEGLLTTQYSSNGTLLKEARTTRFEKVLTVAAVEAT